MSIRHALIAALTAGAFTLSGCGQSETEPAASADSATEDTAAEQESNEATEASESESTDGDSVEADSGDSDSAQAAPAAGGADLSFSATTLEGEAFEGAQLAGKPAVLWFWAPWCPTCLAQAPTVGELADEYDGEVNVVGVGGAAESSEIEGVAKDIEGPTHLIDEPGVVWQHFEITAQSTYVILDADGKVVTDGEFLSDEQLRETVAEVAG
ncbi:MAG: redoxin family protein [Ornithinimicrobium sp.]